MADIPFFVTLQAVLGANAQATLSYQVANNESLTILEWLQKSTGAFDILDIRDSGGKYYTNSSSAFPIDGNFIQDAETAFIATHKLPEPLFLDGGITLYMEVKDTSAAGNTVEIFLVGIRKTP